MAGSCRVPLSGGSAEISFDRFGESADPERPALVCVHGLGGNRSHWDYVARVLASDLQVVTIDLPGFGDSTLPSHRLDFDDLVAAVTGVIRSIGVQRVVIAGHSLGGPLAMRFAALEPGLCAGVLSVAGTVTSFQQTLARKVEPWRRRPRTASATVAEVLLAATPTPTRLQRRLAANAAARRMTLWPFVHDPGAFDAGAARTMIAGSGARGVLPTARATGRIAGWDVDRPRSIPIMAFNGRFDRIAPLADLTELSWSFDRVVIGECAHMPMFECRDHLIDAIGEFTATAA